MTQENTRTIRLKLQVISGSLEEKNETWKRLRQISNEVYKCANWIVGGQYFNDQFNDRCLSREKNLTIKEFEEKIKEVFGVGRQAVTERDAKERFPNLPSCITNPLTQSVFKFYKSDKKEMYTGKRSVRTYKKGMAFDLKSSCIAIEKIEKNFFIKWTVKRNEIIRFKVILGKDKGNYKDILNKLIEGVLNIPSTKLQIDDKDIYLLIPIKEKSKDNKLNYNLSVGVDLGLNVPAYVSLSEGYGRKEIGTELYILEHRIQFAKRYEEVQKGLCFAKSGKGRKRKTEFLENLKEKESKFVNHYNDVISKEIINFALKHKAGVIKLELLKGFSENYKNSFVLRNWNYSGLQQKIIYKAERKGIKVVFIDPYQTSITCSKCGNIDKDQRNGEYFKCIECDTKLHADYNASLNIAKSDKIVTEEKECVCYKSNKKETLKTKIEKSKGQGQLPDSEDSKSLTNQTQHEVELK